MSHAGSSNSSPLEKLIAEPARLDRLADFACRDARIELGRRRTIGWPSVAYATGRPIDIRVVTSKTRECFRNSRDFLIKSAQALSFGVT